MNVDIRLTEEIAKICRQAGHFIRDSGKKVKKDDIIEKSHNSLVSFVDTTAEKMLIDALGKLLPGSTFLSEEATIEQQQSELMWIIDPLDGTTNFLYQIPVFAVSVALQVDGIITAGVVYEVNRDECFYAFKDGGAFMNGQLIEVSNRCLEAALIATGFPYYDYELTDKYLAVLKRFMEQSRGVRRLGAAAVDLAYVACGRFDGFFEYSLAPWDVAAGGLIVQEAGGVVADFKGGDDWLHGRSLLAGNQMVFTEMLHVIEQHFG
jgi:myo-inositol-1(or 4)-monophosphatase